MVYWGLVTATILVLPLSPQGLRRRRLLPSLVTSFSEVRGADVHKEKTSKAAKPHSSHQSQPPPLPQPDAILIGRLQALLV